MEMSRTQGYSSIILKVKSRIAGHTIIIKVKSRTAGHTIIIKVKSRTAGHTIIIKVKSKIEEIRSITLMGKMKTEGVISIMMKKTAGLHSIMMKSWAGLIILGVMKVILAGHSIIGLKVRVAGCIMLDRRHTDGVEAGVVGVCVGGTTG